MASRSTGHARSNTSRAASSRSRREHGAASIGALASAHSTVEELYLLAKLVRGLGSDNIDHRLRQSDFARGDGRCGALARRVPIAELSSCDRVLVIG